MSRRRALEALGPRTAGPRLRGGDRRQAGLGGEQVEGRHAVHELLAAGRREVHEIIVVAGQDGSAGLEAVIALARAAGVPLRSVSPQDLRAIARTEAPQGVIARAAPIEPVDIDSLVAEKGGRDPARAAASRTPFIIVVAGVTDPHNLGAILRSAVGAGATGAVLARHRASHLTPAAVKSAAGAVEHLPIALVPGIAQALTTLKARGVWTVGLDAGGEYSLDELEIAAEPLAIVVGAEGKGLAPLVKRRCDFRCRIPLHGPVESLNVSVAAAIALFSIASRREGAGARAWQGPAGGRRGSPRVRGGRP